MNRLKGILEALSRQVVISEVTKEQRVRYEGGSGLTQTRGYNGGDKSYVSCEHNRTIKPNLEWIHMTNQGLQQRRHVARELWTCSSNPPTLSVAREARDSERIPRWGCTAR